VPAGAVHRFEDLSADFATPVVFWAPMAASERASARGRNVGAHMAASRTQIQAFLRWTAPVAVAPPVTTSAVADRAMTRKPVTYASELVASARSAPEVRAEG